MLSRKEVFNLNYETYDVKHILNQDTKMLDFLTLETLRICIKKGSYKNPDVIIGMFITSGLPTLLLSAFLFTTIPTVIASLITLLFLLYLSNFITMVFSDRYESSYSDYEYPLDFIINNERTYHEDRLLNILNRTYKTSNGLKRQYESINKNKIIQIMIHHPNDYPLVINDIDGDILSNEEYFTDEFEQTLIDNQKLKSKWTVQDMKHYFEYVIKPELLIEKNKFIQEKNLDIHLKQKALLLENDISHIPYNVEEMLKTQKKLDTFIESEQIRVDNIKNHSKQTITNHLYQNN